VRVLVFEVGQRYDRQASKLHNGGKDMQKSNKATNISKRYQELVVSEDERSLQDCRRNEQLNYQISTWNESISVSRCQEDFRTRRSASPTTVASWPLQLMRYSK
jgi:hypothetical protein